MKSKIFLSIIVIMVLSNSCSKGLLDKGPLDKYSDASVWSDLSLVEAFVNQQYTLLPGFDWYDKVRGVTISSASDESIHQYGYDGLEDMNKGALSPSNMTGFDTWNFDYKFIRNCNEFFTKIDDVPGKEELKKRLKGEITFLRAYCYADLVQRYGGVPLVIKSFQLTDDFTMPRSSHDDCVNFIVEELDKAVELLNAEETGANLGRVTKGAALALKSRTLLYSASPLWNASDDRARWQKAADAAKAVIDLPNYHLYQGSNYDRLFLDNNNSEVIFSRAVDRANNVFAAVEATEGPNGGINAAGFYGGWNTNGPSQNLVNDFEMNDGLPINQSPLYDAQDPYKNRDPRFYADILFDGALWHGVPLEFFEGGRNSSQNTANSDANNCTRTAYTKRKHLDPDFDYLNDPLGLSNQSWIIYRLSEMYLNYAEAMFYLDDEATARWALNQIRSRPGVQMPDIAATVTGSALLDRIRNERRIELCFEGHRFFDVRRWKIAEVTDNIPLTGIKIVKNSVTGIKTYSEKIVQERKFFAPRHYLFPIPQYELNKVTLEQNPGYQ
jgi:hypothetical protein